MKFFDSLFNRRTYAVEECLTELIKLRKQENKKIGSILLLGRYGFGRTNFYVRTAIYGYNIWQNRAGIHCVKFESDIRVRRLKQKDEFKVYS